MKIFNGTPHPVNVITNGTSNISIRKMVIPINAQSEIIASIPSSGILSAKIVSIILDPINGIPVFRKKVTHCDPIPKGYDVVIVSTLYVSAARAMGMDMSQLYTVADSVYSSDGRTILGCLGICPAF